MSQDHSDSSKSYGRDQVVHIINSVISKVEHTEDVSRDAIFSEMKQLQKLIEDTRSEIGLANPDAINNQHIPTATDELDAVVEATAEATGTIMDACDVIQGHADKVGGEVGAEIGGQIIKIHEACSFQDITGQRITKTVNTLKTIEQKVSDLLRIMGDNMPGSAEGASAVDEDTRTGDEALLNGPQMQDQAITQDEIDKLLSDF